MKNYVFINDLFLPREEAMIGINDLAILRGYGIFDFFKTINGKPVWLDEHLDRFYYSAGEMQLEVPYEREKLRSIILELMERNDIPGSGIRMTLTGGYSQDGYNPGVTPNLIITQDPFAYDRGSFARGTSLVTFEHQRQLPHVKTIDYLQAIQLQRQLKKQQAQDILYYSGAEILECPRSNFFIVNSNNELVTPARKILGGINRKKILSFRDLEARESIVELEDLWKAKEAFITSTTRIVCPVLKIDGREIGNGSPGEVTRKVWKRMMLEQSI